MLNQLLVVVLDSQNLTLKDVEYINMDLLKARPALLSGQVDVATLAGAKAVAVEKAAGKILTNGEGVIKRTGVIAVRTEFLKEHPDLIKAYFDAYQKALTFMKQHPDETLIIAAKEQKISLEDAHAQMKLYDFTPMMTQDDIINLNTDQNFMIDSGMLQKEKAILRPILSPHLPLKQSNL